MQYVQYVDHGTYYSFFEDVGSNRLIVGFSGSGMIEIDEQRSVPIQWQAPLFREQDVSYLTLTAKMLDFWPGACLDIVEETYMPFRRWFRDINVVGYSMRGWAGAAYARCLEAKRVLLLLLSPRTPGRRAYSKTS